MSCHSRRSSSAGSGRPGALKPADSDPTLEDVLLIDEKTQKTLLIELNRNKKKKSVCSENLKTNEKDLILDVSIEKTNTKAVNSSKTTNLGSSTNLTITNVTNPLYANCLNRGNLVQGPSTRHEVVEQPDPGPNFPQNTQNTRSMLNLHNIEWDNFRLDPNLEGLFTQGFKITLRKRAEFAQYLQKYDKFLQLCLEVDFKNPGKAEQFFIEQDVALRSLIRCPKRFYHSEMHFINYFLESHEIILNRL